LKTEYGEAFFHKVQTIIVEIEKRNPANEETT